MNKNIKYLEAPIPKDEKKRLAAVHKLNILDTPPEERFDQITKLALTLFNVPISTITLVSSNREWFKSCQGLNNREGKRAISFCGHAMLAEQHFIVPDAQKDPRFAKNPMVVGKPYIRFYAAIPLKAADGTRIGAFCIKDFQPRKITPEKINLLKALASWAEIEINAHELSLALAGRQQAETKLAEANDTLRLLNKILRHDLLNHLTMLKWQIESITSGEKNSYSVGNLALAIDRSVNLIHQIGKLESNVSTGTFLRPFLVGGIIEKLIDLFPSVEFKITGEGVVLADEALASVIENIIRNAKIHGKTEKIAINISKRNNFVAVTIADFGKGIPKKIRSKIFEEGFKYGTEGNYGLGLYIAKKTISRYGGKISVKDNKPRGAVFVLKLPSAKPASA